MTTRLLLCAVALGLAFGCLEPISSEDLEAPDAALDGGETDAGPPDAGPPDAGPPDAGTNDSGTSDGGGTSDRCTALFTLSYPDGIALSRVCLRDLPRYQGGPCPTGAADCALQTRTFFPRPDGGFTESVTASGRLWEYDAHSGQLLRGGTSGVELTTLPYLTAFGTGPCRSKAVGACRPETRAFSWTGTETVEVLSLAGSYWGYQSETPTTSPVCGALLIAVPRYAAGPCKGMVADGCHFETDAFVTVSPTQTLEYVTARGRLWVLDAKTGVAQQPDVALTDVPRLAAAACDAGVCRLGTHAFLPLPDGGLLETFTK